MVDKLLTEEQAGELLGVKPLTLRRWRCTGDRIISFVKVGRFVRYREADLQVFIDANLRTKPERSKRRKAGLGKKASVK